MNYMLRAPQLKSGVDQAIDELTGGLKTVSAGLTKTSDKPSDMGAIQATDTINARLKTN
ncbi:hypothetical protein QY890_06465 [Latilactobacillus sakei]